jgi:hypothetical protein
MAKQASHEQEAAWIVAEMMFHIGTGVGAAMAGGDKMLIDLMAKNAPAISHDHIKSIYEKFHGATAKSLRKKKLAYEHEWRKNDQKRILSLLCSVLMGELAERKHQASVAGQGRALDFDDLFKALIEIRTAHCDPKKTVKGGGPTCDF